MDASLGLAFYILCAAVAVGAGLALSYLRRTARGARPIARIHGVLGLAGLAVLAFVLRRGVPSSAMGTAGFVPTAALLLALALALGATIAVMGRRRQRPPGLLVAIHAGVAITGFVVLWTVVSLG